MSVKAELTAALKTAMRSGDETRKRVIRLTLANIKLAEVERGGQLAEPDILSILQKEVKSRRETIADARQAGRPDLAQEAEAEIIILHGFLPQPLTGAELEQLARQVITQLEATSPGDIGRVMKELMPRLGGRAEGSQASQVVRRLLQSN